MLDNFVLSKLFKKHLNGRYPDIPALNKNCKTHFITVALYTLWGGATLPPFLLVERPDSYQGL